MQKLPEVGGLSHSHTKVLNKAVDIKDLSANIEELTVTINAFTQGILQTYEMSETTDLEEMVYIRGKVVEHALAYTAHVSPLCKDVMKEIREIFETIENIDDVEEFGKSLNYLCKSSDKVVKRLGVCEELHNITKTYFKADEKMASSVVTQLAKTNATTNAIVAKAREKTTQLKTKKEKAKQDGGGIFENSLKIFDGIKEGLNIGSWIGKGLDWGVDAYKRREIRKLLNNAIKKEPNAIRLFIVEEQINVVIVPAIRLFIKTLDKVKEVLSEFANELGKLNKNEADHETKLNQYFNNVKKHAEGIQANALDMITYFGTCEAEINVFHEVEEKRLSKLGQDEAEKETLKMQQKYEIAPETSTLSELLATTRKSADK